MTEDNDYAVTPPAEADGEKVKPEPWATIDRLTAANAALEAKVEIAKGAILEMRAATPVEKRVAIADEAFAALNDQQAA